MVQTRSKSSLSTNVAFMIPSSPQNTMTKANDNSNRSSKGSSNQTFNKPVVAPPLPSTLYKKQQHNHPQENALQLEDINSIPDPPTPPNPSTLQKSVAVAVANAKRRRVSAATRRLSLNSKMGHVVPLQQQRGSHSNQKSDKSVCVTSNYVSRKFSSRVDNTIGGDGICKNQVVLDDKVTNVDYSNDSDMSIDISIDQQPRPLPTHQHTNSVENRTNRSSICYDDSSNEEEEEEDKKKIIQKRRRQSMFQKKDQASNDNISLDDDYMVDGQKRERVNLGTNINKKRTRRSILLPDEVLNDEEKGEEETDPSRIVPYKRRRKPGRGRRSLLLPSEAVDDFHSESWETSNGATSFQNLRDNVASSSHKSEKGHVPSSSTTISTAAITHTNLVYDGLPNGNETISSVLNIEKSNVELKQEGQKQGKQISARKFSSLQIDKLNQMKVAVRKFCAIPLEERYKSEDADILHITEIIGYPIISSIDKLRYQHEKEMDANKRDGDASTTSSLSLDWTSSPSNSQSALDARIRTRSATKRVEGGVVDDFVVTNEMKRNIIGKMCPIIERMEVRRKEEVAFVEERTNCQVERKKGKYKYVSLSTGKKVSSSKYQKLYLDMVGKRRLELQQERRDRIEADAHHTAVLQQKESSKRCASNRQQKDRVISLESEERKEPLKEWNDSIKNIGKKLLIGEQLSDHGVNKTGSEEPQCVPEEEDEILMPEVCCSSNTNTTNEGTTKGIEIFDRGYSGDEDENLTIGDDIPSRDNLSLDPEIATLQTTLFSKIDMALQTYSDEVLKLQERRRGGLHIPTDI